MHTEITFSMDTSSRAPDVMGAWLVPRTARYSPRWFDRGEHTFVALLVTSSVVDELVKKVCSLHPSVRCINREEHPAA